MLEVRSTASACLSVVVVSPCGIRAAFSTCHYIGLSPRFCALFARLARGVDYRASMSTYVRNSLRLGRRCCATSMSGRQSGRYRDRATPRLHSGRAGVGQVEQHPLKDQTCRQAGRGRPLPGVAGGAYHDRRVREGRFAVIPRRKRV